MKAIVFDRFGGTEVLHESDIEIPEPGAGGACPRQGGRGQRAGRQGPLGGDAGRVRDAAARRPWI